MKNRSDWQIVGILYAIALLTVLAGLSSPLSRAHQPHSFGIFPSRTPGSWTSSTPKVQLCKSPSALAFKLLGEVTTEKEVEDEFDSAPSLYYLGLDLPLLYFEPASIQQMISSTQPITRRLRC